MCDEFYSPGYRDRLRRRTGVFLVWLVAGVGVGPAAAWQTATLRDPPRASINRHPGLGATSGEASVPGTRPGTRPGARSPARDIRLTGAELEISGAETEISVAETGMPGEFRRTVDERPLTEAPLPTSATSVSSDRPERPLALAPPRSVRPDGNRRPTGSSSARAVTTVTTSLAIVLGAFALLVWFSRRNLPSGMQRLPTEVVQLLGRSSLNGRQQLQLLKFGNKLVLLNVSAGGAETLTEITDPDEVHRLAALCLQHQPNSVSNTFREVLAQLGEERQRTSLSVHAGTAEAVVAGRAAARRREEGSIHG